MRGALRARPMTRIPPGIIPADAGSTSGPAYDPNSARDHPRGCGEHNRISSNNRSQVGSSPRMRGARLGMPMGSILVRIIPADAGSTYWCAGWRVLNRDHPRGCGEHGTVGRQQVGPSGSSPRMRGAPAGDRIRGRLLGIIPADAGSTSVWCSRRLPAWDHPRGCGEHIRHVAFPRALVGSSPRMRGALASSYAGAPEEGIIPADAGSTTGCSDAATRDRDHPRGCGEHRRSLLS